MRIAINLLTEDPAQPLDVYWEAADHKKRRQR
jgi:hypothetical protein